MAWGRLGISGTLRSHPKSTNFHRDDLQRQAHPLLQSIRLCGPRLGPRERVCSNKSRTLWDLPRTVCIAEDKSRGRSHINTNCLRGLWSPSWKRIHHHPRDKSRIGYFWRRRGNLLRSPWRECFLPRERPRTHPGFCGPTCGNRGKTTRTQPLESRNLRVICRLHRHHMPEFWGGECQGETVFGDRVSRRDGLSLVCWLVLMGKAVQSRRNPTVYAHVEANDIYIIRKRRNDQTQTVWIVILIYSSWLCFDD